jgi:hypothetical protein
MLNASQRVVNVHGVGYAVTGMIWPIRTNTPLIVYVHIDSLATAELDCQPGYLRHEEYL